MTNEEIEKAATQLLHDLGYGVSEWGLPTTTKSLRSLVSQAYEEAAGKAEGHCAELLEGMSQAARDDDSRTHDRLNHAYGEARHIVDDLRALKDQLVPEPVSSLP